MTKRDRSALIGLVFIVAALLVYSASR